MPENEIFDKILSDYVAAKEFSGDQSGLKDFCAYAKTWFAQSGVVGLGHTATGLALRFQDGTERLLFSNDQPTVADMPAMSITGMTGGSVRGGGGVADTSFRITG